MRIENLRLYLISLDVVIDNEYLTKYCNLIISNINQTSVPSKTQRHHIVPKYVYQHFGIAVDDSESNIVNLYYKDHLLAHYYLAMCSSTAEYIGNNVLAIRYVLNGKKLTDIDEVDIDFDKYQQLYELSRQNIYMRRHIEWMRMRRLQIQCEMCGKQDSVLMLYIQKNLFQRQIQMQKIRS